MTLILKGISRSINRNWIIKELNFEVDDGECLAILGPSGCGKSSTLRVIAGLDKPDEGEIYINNIDVTNVSPVARRVGMVFQNYALYPHLSVASNLSLGLKVRGVSKVEQRKRVSSILSVLQLDHLSTRLPAELSGGQRQRVALARALLRDPLVYLLDEPMSNLDAQLREELRPELRRLILNGQQPVLYVTHDQQEAMAMADRIALLNNGFLEQIGTPEELYKNPRSIFTAKFIGRPQINFLKFKDGLITAVRPENIYLSREGYQCKVIYKEWLGMNQLLFLESSLGSIKMICKSDLKVNEKVTVNWDTKDEFQFDTHTGKRLDKAITKSKQIISR